MLSEVEAEGKGKTVGRLIQFQFGNVALCCVVPCGACVEEADLSQRWKRCATQNLMDPKFP